MRLGANVVTVDPAPGMQADVIAPAEHLPFAGRELRRRRMAARRAYVSDALGALKEMARVAPRRVVICDNTFVSESSEEADRLRDPSHVRNYGVDEWKSFFELAGLEVARGALHGAPTRGGAWLARTDCAGADAAQVRELLGDRIVDGWDGFADAHNQGGPALDGDHRRR